jgi:transcriptional regulator with XRE-family HTH domain
MNKEKREYIKQLILEDKKRNKLTFNDLSKKVGVSPGTIFKILTSETEHDFKTLQLLCRAYGLKSSFFDDEEFLFPSSNHSKNTDESIKTMEPVIKESIRIECDGLKIVLSSEFNKLRKEMRLLREALGFLPKLYKRAPKEKAG